MRVFRFLPKPVSLIFMCLRIMSNITLQTQIRGRYIKMCLFLNHRTWVEFALAGYSCLGGGGRVVASSRPVWSV